VKTYTKWYLLVLSAVTNALVVAAPGMGLSVLFKEISGDLHLNLVQVGVIWGIGALPGIFTVLLGGAIGDRFGPKRILLWGTLLVGLSGALRGLANDFVSLLAAVILVGLLTPLVNMNSFKTCNIWFPRHQLGLANGVLSMGMALGFLLGAFLSATILSPWLGGWRNVLIFYGALGVLISIPWYFTPAAPEAVQLRRANRTPISMRQAVAHVARLKNIWLLGWTILGISGCVQSALGYLPLYLRGQGWASVNADSALSMFHMMSLVFVLPIALLSDRLGARKRLLLGMGLMIVTGVGLLSATSGIGVWGAVILSGMVRDGFMALFMTMIVETEGVGPLFAGTATGFVMVFAGIGNLFAPPLGNKLAEISAGLPFALWAALAAAGIACLALTTAAKTAGLPNVVNPAEAEEAS
jgi:MFS family permease